MSKSNIQIISRVIPSTPRSKNLQGAGLGNISFSSASSSAGGVITEPSPSVEIVPTDSESILTDQNVFSTLRVIQEILSRIIKGSDQVEATDENTYSALHIDNELAQITKLLSDLDAKYLRKDKPDSTNHLLQLNGGIEIGSTAKINKHGEATFKSVKSDKIVTQLIESVNAILQNIDSNKATITNITTTDILVKALALVHNLRVEDTATLLKAVVKDYLSSPTFRSGFLGEGFRIHKTEDGSWDMELDTLTVRKVFQVFELLIQEVKHQGGVVIHSPAGGKITKVTDGGSYWKCEVEGADTFFKDDLVLCQKFTGKNIKRYWRLATSAGDGFVNLSKTDCEANSAIPEVDDEIATLGNKTNTARQSAYLISVVGADAPYTAYYSGINSYSLKGKEHTRIGNLEGVVSPAFGPLKGSGAHLINAYVQGMIRLQNGKTVETVIDETSQSLSSDIGKVRTDLQGDVNSSITSVKNELNATVTQVEHSFNNSIDKTKGELSATINKVQGDADSAKGLAQSAQESIDNLDIGGPNLAVYSEIAIYIGGGIKSNDGTYKVVDLKTIEAINQHTNSYAIGFSLKNINRQLIIHGKSNLFNERIGVFYNIMNNEGTWSGQKFVFMLTNSFGEFEFKLQLKGVEVLLGVSHLQRKNYTISELVIQQGNKPTDWTPAPEDVEAQITKNKEEAESASKAYADAQDNLKLTESNAYADGKVTAEEKRAIADATSKLAAAKAYSDAKDKELKILTDAYADGVISVTEAKLIQTSKDNLEAAKKYAEAQDELLKVQTNAYADGKVSEEEKRAIEDAQAKLDAAKAYAKAQDGLLKIQQEAYADGKITAEEKRAIADAQAKLDAAKKYAETQDAFLKTKQEAYADNKVSEAEQRAINEAQAKVDKAKKELNALIEGVQSVVTKKITDVEQSFVAADGRINSHIKETTQLVTEAQLTTKESVKTLEQVKVQINDINVTAGKINTTLGEVTKKQGEINSSISNLEQTAGSFKASIDGFKETEQQIKATANKIEVTHEGIVLEASEKSAKKVIERLEIGGKNLFSYSIMKKGYIYPDSNDSVLNYKNFQYTPSFISTYGYKYVTYTVYDYGHTKERGYSISFYDTEKKSIQQDYSWDTKIGEPVVIKLKDGVKFLRFTIVDTGIKAKLELGNKPTDWSPAPEDLATQTNYSDIESSLTQTKEEIKGLVKKTDFYANNEVIAKKMSEISQKSDKISLQVSAQDSRISGVDGRVRKAELALKSDNIWLAVKDNTKKEVDDLDIGGRNLVVLKDICTYIGGNLIANKGIYVVSNINTITVINQGISSELLGIPLKEIYNGVVIHGVSSYKKERISIYYSILGSDNKWSEQDSKSVITDSNGHFIFKLNISGAKIRMGVGHTQFNNYTIRYLMIEEGNKPTRWQPAFEDNLKSNLNLLTTSKDFKIDTGSDGKENHKVDFYRDEDGFMVTKMYDFIENGYPRNRYKWVHTLIPKQIEPNTSYTLSFDYRSTRDGGKLGIDVRYPSLYIWTDRLPNTYGKWIRVSATGNWDTIPYNYTQLLEFDSLNFGEGTYEIKKIKFEKNGVATSYTLAPEDYSTTDDIVSSFDMTTNGIALLGKNISLTGKVTFNSLDTGLRDDFQNFSQFLYRDIGNLAYEDKVEKAKLGSTVIEGGFLKTELIRANSITADKLNVGSLVARHLKTSDSGARIEAIGSELKIYGLAEHPNIVFGVNNQGYATLAYYSNDGKLIYDLGPRGIDWGSIRPAAWNEIKLVATKVTSKDPRFSDFSFHATSKPIYGTTYWKYFAGSNPTITQDEKQKEYYTYTTKGNLDRKISDGWYMTEGAAMQTQAGNTTAWVKPFGDNGLYEFGSSVRDIPPIYFRNILKYEGGQVVARKYLCWNGDPFGQGENDGGWLDPRG